MQFRAFAGYLDVADGRDFFNEIVEATECNTDDFGLFFSIVVSWKQAGVAGIVADQGEIRFSTGISEGALGQLDDTVDIG